MWPDDFALPNSAPEHPESDLAAFALNALDGPEHRSVARHVAQCLHCQEVLLGFQGMAARLAVSVPETPLPSGLKSRVLSAVTHPYAAPPPTPQTAPSAAAAALPPPSSRWSMRRLRRWLAPAAIGALTLLLAISAGFIVLQQREISRLSAGDAAAAAPPLATAASATAPGRPADAQQVDLVRQEMADVVEATVLSAQDGIQKMPMSSPMGTEPDAKGVLMVDPDGRQAMLMVSGMPADSYQIWLARADKQTLIGRIVVNADDDGSSVQSLDLDESVFDFQQVALLPDERNGPTVPSGEKFLTARITNDSPPSPNR